MFVIGTAGHVDHGKSTLVEALTGIHPDRLKEEQEREMTIDLGFAWLELPNGEEIGIVDVPGHRDFIENMLAGVGGIDAVLFVVAGDEGVMPQTREHLAILDLLQIQGGIIALTKSDLVDDEWLSLVEEDVRQTVIGTILENAPIIPVSARSGAGLQALLTALVECLADRPTRPDLRRPRLPIDRIFTIAGFGSVVTGTLSDGKFQTGDEIEISPVGARGRIRGLQTHKKKEDFALPGSRTAINISGISTDQIRRGLVVTHPGDYIPSRRLDVRFRLLPDIRHPIRHNIDVKFFIGAAEVIARVRLLGSEQLLPGDEGWLQLELEEPVVALRGDRFILRRPSPGETLGGGVILDPHPKGRHKRFSNEVISRLESLTQGTPADLVSHALIKLGIAQWKDVIDQVNLEPELIDQAAHELVASNSIVLIDRILPLPAQDTLTNTGLPGISLKELVTSRQHWDRIGNKFLSEIKQFHQNYPLRPGIPREELKSRLRSLLPGNQKVYNAVVGELIAAREIEESGLFIRINGFVISFSRTQNQITTRLLDKFISSPYSPPSVKECRAEVGDDLFQALLDTAVLKLVSEEVVFRVNDYDAMVKQTVLLLQANGLISAAQVRDHFNTSRKYALAFLEHLDNLGITRREGDYRRLGSNLG